MGSEDGRTSPSVAEKLFSEPYRFDFFQAVRIIDRLFLEKGKADPEAERRPVGRDHDPARESVRFRALQSLGFPSSAVTHIGSAPSPARPAAQPEMTVSFMGLTGPSGVLPDHYTLLLMERLREKEFALQDFFDLFNHRLVSLFFRAWQKYRFPTLYERSRLYDGRDGEDLFTQSLYCVIGLGTSGLRGRMPCDDEALLYYSGFYADNHRPAVSLESLLSDYFEVPVEVLQFQGQWLDLTVDCRSAVGTRGVVGGHNNELGVNVIVGERVWDVQSTFRVRLGPLTYDEYCWLIPRGDGLRGLWHLVRSFVGPEFDFEVQPILKAGEARPCVVGTSGNLLGWTAWLLSGELAEEFEEAHFALPG